MRTLVNGFLFGSGAVIAVVVIRVLFHVGICG